MGIDQNIAYGSRHGSMSHVRTLGECLPRYFGKQFFVSYRF
jgi:hypothetical protein